MVWNPPCVWDLRSDSNILNSSCPLNKRSTWHAQALVTQTVKNLPMTWEIQVWSLGQEDLLEKGLATHSSILVWRIPWTEEPGELQSTGSQRVRHDWAADTFTDLHTLSLHLSALCLMLGQLTDHESLRQDPPPSPLPQRKCAPLLSAHLSFPRWHWLEGTQWIWMALERFVPGNPDPGAILLLS